MLRVALETEPYWIDYDAGTRIRVRPLNAVVHRACLHRGARAIQDITDAGDTLASIGFPVDLEEMQDDPSLASGVSHVVYGQSLARSGLIAWEGVSDAEGNDLPLTPENINRFMLMPGVCDWFVERYTRAHNQMVAEGNASGAVSNGISATAPTTAANAGSKDYPAPVAAPAATESDAPTSGTNRKRKKAGRPSTSPAGQPVS